MKLDLRENMYIRTNYGKIDKILEIKDSYVIGVLPKDSFYAYYIDSIVKASYNIIDLIEVGDYVNGECVNDIVNGRPFHEDYNDPYYSYVWDNEEIKSVITHEQMEQMAYKVEE